MGEDLKALLSNDVYTAFKNIASTKKELGGGRDKKNIDSTTEYNKLAQLLAGNGEVARNKMTDTDIKTLEAELANAAKWKPAGDEYEKGSCSRDKKDNDMENKQKEAYGEKKPTNNETNKGAEAPNTTPSATKKPENSGKPVSKQPQRKEAAKTQNNNFNNSGVNNSFNNNSGTIMIDNSIHFGAVEKTDSAKTAPAPSDEETKPSDKSKEQKKEDTIRANKENYQVAYDEGAQTAKDLIGYTTLREKTRAIRTIMKQSENTIIGFMKGYYSEDDVWGISYGIGELLDQVDNENGWTDAEKRRVFTKVMESTLKYAENTGNTENSNYKELSKLLKDVKAGREINTETADEYIKQLISDGAVDVNS